MKMIGAMLLVILVGLQYKLWWGDEGLLQRRNLENKLALKKIENERLAARNHALEADIIELKQGDQALEEQARFELGMVKENETYYQFAQ